MCGFIAEIIINRGNIMKISLEWLNELVDISDLTAEEIAHGLTMSGLEVEEIEKTSAKFTNIITARIEAIHQHPNADKLHLVEVNLGNTIKTVVCGAQNIEVGQVIPYASVGSKVLNRKTGEQFELTPAVIRGVESQGMLCSQDELGLENMQEEDGILILNRLYQNLELGKKLEDVLGIKEDTIIDVAPTANRGDEMSVLGVAREICAIFNKKLNFSHIEFNKDLNTDKFKVEILDEDTCKYYSAALIKDVKIKPSPSWLKRRLEASGIRSINNIVDITNYVLLEYGQPLHAFDMDKLNGYLCVRRAKDGETIVTLDEVERKLTTDSVLIATKEEGVCVAGVFGGHNSEVDENTKNIVLESAYFTPHTNRKSARSVGYRSEASARFERGVDIESTKPALFRAMQLLVDLADAKIEGVVETGNNKLPEQYITLRYSFMNKLLGCEIAPETCTQILEHLGFKLCGKNDSAARYSVPSYRANDVTRECDLIEEISRIYGYDKIEPTLPKKTITPEVSDETKIIRQINNLFLGYGFNEAISSSLIGKPLLKQFGLSFDDSKAVYVQNPQSEEHTMLRQTLIVNMLQAVKLNSDNGQKNVWLYEIGKTYFVEREATLQDGGVRETQMVSGVMTGESNPNLWKQTEKVDFYTLKGMLMGLFDMLGISNRIRISPIDNSEYLHPGKSAKVELLGKPQITLGYFGEIYPILKDDMKLTKDVYLFELNLDAIVSAVANKVVKYKHLEQFPEVQRDISFAIKSDITNEKIVNAIKKSVDPKLFRSCDVFDVYQGECVENGFKSVAYRIKLQNSEMTMTDEMIDSEMNKVRAGLEKQFSEVKFR